LLLSLRLSGWRRNSNLPGNIEFFPQKGTPYAAALRQLEWTEQRDSGSAAVRRREVHRRHHAGVVQHRQRESLKSNINFLSIPASIYAPSSEAGLRTTDIRTQGALVADMSLAKTIRI
jgi:hypothetical protein